MQTADRAAFQQLMTDAHAFYRQDVSTFALSVWWQACEGFSIEQVSKALTAHAMDPERGQFPPKPADVVRQLRGTFGDRSLVAWGYVLSAIQRVGQYTSVDFDDLATHCAIEDIGGWGAVCRSTVDELPFLQRRFCEAHRVYASRPQECRQVPYLPGAHEIANQASGRPSEPAMRLGAAAAKARGQVGTTGTPASTRVCASPLAQPGAGTTGDKPVLVVLQ